MSMQTFVAKNRQGIATESQESILNAIQLFKHPYLCLVHAKERIVHVGEQAELLATSGEGENQLHRELDCDSDVTI